jgi:hypothetical protein
MGFHVILDWVGNHSAWINPLAAEHPGWYSKFQGNFVSPFDWTDVTRSITRRFVVGLHGRRHEILVEEAGIDGFAAIPGASAEMFCSGQPLNLTP